MKTSVVRKNNAKLTDSRKIRPPLLSRSAFGTAPISKFVLAQRKKKMKGLIKKPKPGFKFLPRYLPMTAQSAIDGALFHMKAREKIFTLNTAGINKGELKPIFDVLERYGYLATINKEGYLTLTQTSKFGRSN